MRTEHPVFGFFPALPLFKNLEFGEWLVGTPPKDAPWRSDVFRELAQRLLTSIARRGFRDPALLWHRTHGLSGDAPAQQTVRAIQTAVRFAALDANDRYSLTDLNRGSFITTSENAALYLQPIDEQNKRITHRQGGALRRVLVGGLEIGEGDLPLPDAVVSVLRPVHASRNVARAVHRAVVHAGSKKNRRVAIAAQWHAIAMANSNAVTPEQRIIALKTAFEALFGTSGSRECARRLRSRFESVTKAHSAKLPWAGVLWSPTERTDLVRRHKTKCGVVEDDMRSEIEDWFMKLAHTRNCVIHEGVLPDVDYHAPLERPLSRYAGNLLWIGERVLREAVKATLGEDVLLCGRIAEWKQYEGLAVELLQANSVGDVAAAHDVSQESSAEAAVRSVETLLKALQAPAANHVLLRKAVGQGSASLEVARENARAMRDMCVALTGGRELLITSAERELLRARGAEDELSDYVAECD